MVALCTDVEVTKCEGEVAIFEGVVLKTAMDDVVMVGFPMSRQSHEAVGAMRPWWGSRHGRGDAKFDTVRIVEDRVEKENAIKEDEVGRVNAIKPP